MSNIRLGTSRPKQAASQTTKGRVQRLMPLKNLLGETKIVKRTANSPKSNIRTLSLRDGSLRVTTKQPELCRKAIVSSRSLKIVTPSNSISKTDTTETETPRRTLENDLYTSRLSNIVEEDLRTSSPNLSFTSLTEERPSLFRKSGTRPVAQNIFGVSNLMIVCISNTCFNL